MVYTLNTHVISRFNDLRKASEVFQEDSSDITSCLSPNDLLRREAIDQLFSLFQITIQIFNDIDRNADLLTPSAIALMKDKDSLADHLLYFTDCYDVFNGSENELTINAILGQLNKEYDLLRNQYEQIVNALLPSKELSLKELLKLLRDIDAHSNFLEYKEFFEQRTLIIQYIDKLEQSPSNLTLIKGFNLRENLNILLALAPLQLKSELEKINLQLILHYEILDLKAENQIPISLGKAVQVEANPNAILLMIASIAICLFGLSLFVDLTFLSEFGFTYDEHEHSEGYCSATYEL
jgi:hypothetical protein